MSQAIENDTQNSPAQRVSAQLEIRRQIPLKTPRFTLCVSALDALLGATIDRGKSTLTQFET